MGSTVFRKLHRKFNVLLYLPSVYSRCVCHEFVFSVFVTSALRGASSKRKRSSLQVGKAASQEFLSTQKEKEKEEKKAQSMDNLDGNCNINFTSIFLI